ncbi:uncharacterized protein LODBEIA_P05900 [Lodderomyces beijingensis]|uniref:SPIN90/Ldb17 leucine-rich domain-containing protein n=1 Tax=Lodderomyces beijingensis TaxID=1775926 RepID=A0ABP0ZGU4_9ASCO
MMFRSANINLSSPLTESPSYIRAQPQPITTSTTMISLSSTTISLATQSVTTRSFVDDEVNSVLVNSDPSECNENFSIFIKCIIDNVYVDTKTTPTYQELSLYALKLLMSNLFVKNYKFCVGKMLAFLETFTAITEQRLLYGGGEQQEDLEEEHDEEEAGAGGMGIVDERVKYESECLKEFLCIVLLLLLKLKNSTNENDVGDDESLSSCSSSTNEALDLINIEELFGHLQRSKFLLVMCQFITTQIRAVHMNQSSFVILKFGCDLVFEYLYYSEILSSQEISDLSSKDNKMIPTLIKYLLTSEDFHNYELDNDDEFHDESRLVAYEELKLLLLINEQFLMTSYTEHEASNRVFDELIHNNQDYDEHSNMNNIVGLINLLIYHLNREESQIIKLLILKFLYLVFTTPFTAKLIYRNDLKILIDIFIRELNNLEHKDAILIITYLRVLYPILEFSELKECGAYKSKEILDVLSHTITNSESRDGQQPTNSPQPDENAVARQLASKCMKVRWLRKSGSNSSTGSGSGSGSGSRYGNGNRNGQKEHTSSPSSSLPPSQESSPEKTGSREGLTSATKPPPFARVASMRSSSRSDYHKHTTAHNTLERKNSEKLKKRITTTTTTTTKNEPAARSMFEENNNNVFLAQFSTHMSLQDTQDSVSLQHSSDGDGDGDGDGEDSNILDLPNEYLNSKPLPQIPVSRKSRSQFYQHGNASNASSSCSINSDSSIRRKAMKKKAPPPPPPPPRRHR